VMHLTIGGVLSTSGSRCENDSFTTVRYWTIWNG
jgi:hypothetical protein